ncbi:hypothetical protein QE152_g22997 [Popillia japonica]|uniref:Uncharacterized protein n=1 Tax=Popillia japonica TaxID=7064 RepID=A0AAW1KKB5_POPJA
MKGKNWEEKNIQQLRCIGDVRARTSRRRKKWIKQGGYDSRSLRLESRLVASNFIYPPYLAKSLRVYLYVTKVIVRPYGVDTNVSLFQRFICEMFSGKCSKIKARTKVVHDGLKDFRFALITYVFSAMDWMKNAVRGREKDDLHFR